MFLLLLLAVVLLLGFGFLAPARLALMQEHLLGVVHGGVIAHEERTYVDGCVWTSDAEGPQAVVRTERTTTFRDGTSLTVVFNSRPAPTNARCNG